jgi:hypothetical protein
MWLRFEPGTSYTCLKCHHCITKLLCVDSWWFLTCPSWQVVVGAALFLPWQEEQAKAWKQTCVPRIHTKECGYLGLPQDTNMHCKNLNQDPVLASSVLEGQAVPWNQTPVDAPETMKTGLCKCSSTTLQPNGQNTCQVLFKHNFGIKWSSTIQVYCSV